MNAAKRDDIALIDRLLTPDTVNGDLPDVDVNEADQKGRTALHHAASKGSNRALLALLQHGARTDLLTRKGATALMLAAKNGRRVAVEILLTQHDSSSTSDSNSGTSTPLDKSNIYHCQLATQRYDDMSEDERQGALCNAVVTGKPDLAARMLAIGGLDFEYPEIGRASCRERVL